MLEEEKCFFFHMKSIEPFHEFPKPYQTRLWYVNKGSEGFNFPVLRQDNISRKLVIIFIHIDKQHIVINFCFHVIRGTAIDNFLCIVKLIHLFYDQNIAVFFTVYRKNCFEGQLIFTICSRITSRRFC